MLLREVEGVASRPRHNFYRRSQRLTISPRFPSALTSIRGSRGVLGKRWASRRQLYHEGNDVAAGAHTRTRIPTCLQYDTTCFPLITLCCNEGVIQRDWPGPSTVPRLTALSSKGSNVIRCTVITPKKAVHAIRCTEERIVLPQNKHDILYTSAIFKQQ